MRSKPRECRICHDGKGFRDDGRRRLASHPARPVGPGFELESNPYDTTGFKAGIVQYRCLVSCDVAVRLPGAFVAATSITWSTARTAMQTTNRLRVTYNIHVAGTPCKVGDVIEVDDETAHDLFNCERAETADAATAQKFRARPRITWSDPAEVVEHRPTLHVVKAV
jgi:hypothetical protein